MKKAKLLLSGIAVLAIVGTALAFNVQKETKVLWTGSTEDFCFRTFYVTTTSDYTQSFLYYTTTGPASDIVKTTCEAQTFIAFTND